MNTENFEQVHFGLRSVGTIGWKAQLLLKYRPSPAGPALNTIHRLRLGLLALSLPQETFPVRSLDHLRRHLLLFSPQGAADGYVRHLEVTIANKTKTLDDCLTKATSHTFSHRRKLELKSCCACTVSMMHCVFAQPHVVRRPCISQGFANSMPFCNPSTKKQKKES